MTMIGYARCSTAEQNVDDQCRRLIAAGCARDDVFKDEGVSGKLASRPQWDACLKYLRSGDTLVITKLDRAGRSLQHLITLANQLRERGVELKVLDQDIDTGTAMGRMFYQIMGAVAEFERELIIERTHDGLRTARLSGKKAGPKPKLSTKQQDEVRRMHADGKTIVYIAEVMKVSLPVIYRVLDGAVTA
jgi:DNA invertase Pin-like site-specific DNA recombinase